jgi:hypothetical protein
MKLFVKFLKIICLSAAIGFIVLLLSKSNHFNCSALDAFDNDFVFFFVLIKRLLVALGIWLIGLIAYFLIKKEKRISLLLYFSLLTIISLHSFIIAAFTREPERNRSLKQQICNKSTDDGMMLTFLNLDKDEYDFINSKKKWLPAVPNTTEIINLTYYRDEFLGDYDLIIDLKLRLDERIDTLKYPKWTFDGKIYHYREFAM